jgi:hypothetical protein
MQNVFPTTLRFIWKITSVASHLSFFCLSVRLQVMNSRQIQIKLVNILYTYNAACGAIFISVSVNFMGSFIMGFSSYMEHSR